MERTGKFLDAQTFARRPAMIMHGPSRAFCCGTDGTWPESQFHNCERAAYAPRAVNGSRADCRQRVRKDMALRVKVDP